MSKSQTRCVDRIVVLVLFGFACAPQEQFSEVSQTQLEPPVRRLWRLEDSPAAELAMTSEGELWAVSQDGVVQRFGDEGSIEAELQLEGVDGYPTLVAAPDGGVHVCAEAASEEPSSAAWKVDRAGGLSWRRDFPGLEFIDCATTSNGTLVLTAERSQDTTTEGRLVRIAPAGAVEQEFVLDRLWNSDGTIASLGDTAYVVSAASTVLRLEPEGAITPVLMQSDERLDSLSAAPETLLGGTWSPSGFRLTGWDLDGTRRWTHTIDHWGVGVGLANPRPRPLSDTTFATLTSYRDDHEVDSPLRPFVHVRLLTTDGIEAAGFTIQDEALDTTAQALAGRCSDDGLCTVAVRGASFVPGELSGTFFLDLYEVDLREQPEL